MAKILFGYDNLLFRSGVSVTAGDQAGDNVDDNLLNVHPNSFWRADDLALSYVQIDLGAYRRPTLACILYSTATPRRTLLRNTDAIPSSGNWTLTNLASTALDADLDPPPSEVAQTAGPSTRLHVSSTGTHYAEQKLDLTAYNSAKGFTSFQVATRAYINATANNNAHLEIELAVDDNAGNTAEASIEVDAQTMHLANTNTGGAATVSVDTSTVTVDGDWGRADLVASFGGISGANVDLYTRYYVLDASRNRSYASSSEFVHILAPITALGSSILAHEENPSAAGGARWTVKSDTSAITPSGGSSTLHQGVASVASSAQMDAWRDAHGWGHAWSTLPSSSIGNQHWLVELHDGDNVDSQVDLSNIYLGPYHQPSHGLADPADFKESLEETIRESEAGGGQEYRGGTGVKRIWTIRLPFATQAEAEGELHDLGIKLGRTQPVVVIRDPDETTYGQQHILYGYVDVWDRVGQWLNADGTLRYTVTMTLRELLP